MAKTTTPTEATTESLERRGLTEEQVRELQKDLASLEGRARELTACLKAMTLVGSSLDLDEVLDRAIMSAMEVMNAEASSVMLLDDETGELYFKQAAGEAASGVREIRIPRGQGIAGWCAEHGEAVVVSDAQNDARFFKEADKQTGFVTRSILAVPLQIKEKIIGVAEAINKRDGHFTETDLPLFSAYASLAAVAIENARLHHQLLEQEIVAREIEIAKEIQNALLGPSSASLGKFRFFAASEPARSVGGDFYDWVELGSGRAMIALGDVSSKGIPAAMLMSNTLSQLRTEALRTQDPAACLTALNRSLSTHISRGMFVTLFVAFIEPDGRFLYSTAGHPLPVYMHGDEFREFGRLKNPPVGIVPTHRFALGERKLSDGDILVLYSDGVSEAATREREFFGVDRLKETVRGHAADPEKLVPAIRDAVLQFEAGAEQSDDMTIAALAFGSRRKELVLSYQHMTAADLREIRRLLDTYLTDLNVPEKQKIQVVLAIDEACANIIRHAYGGTGGPVRFSCASEAEGLQMVLIDDGCGKVPCFPPSGPREIKPGGLGLRILRDVMDEVEFESRSEGGCVLRMKKRLDTDARRA